MAVDHIRYDLLTQDAMRGVIRAVLRDAAGKGLPGDHHFFITFDTRAPGVKLSTRLRAQYAKEMTIVLQHQFWDLTVTDDGVEVGLSFNGIPERLTVPFAAINDFADPAAKFRLQFASVDDERAIEDGASPLAANALVSGAAEAAAPLPAPEPQQQPDKPTAGAEVVRLDRFRKK
jgi:hypothetical protein